MSRWGRFLNETLTGARHTWTLLNHDDRHTDLTILRRFALSHPLDGGIDGAGRTSRQRPAEPEATTEQPPAERSGSPRGRVH